MKNRVAWVLVGMLALALLGASPVLIISYQHWWPQQQDDMALYFRKQGLVIGYKSHLPPLWQRAALLPRSDWGFGRYAYAMIDDSSRTVFECREGLRVGFFSFQLK